MKKLQFSSIDLLKYTEQVIDKQPTEPEIKAIVQSYVENLHPSHIAIAVPLDQNADFLAHGHVPSPLTVDEFTRVWINAIHNAGVNVYFRGTFCGIKGIFDFGFDKNTPIGTADTAITDGKNTWMGRIYQWLNTNLSYIKPGDIIGIIPEGTNNAFNGNFFLPLQPNPQTDYLTFYVELKKLCDTMTTTIKPIYTGFSANVYRDIVTGWIPSFLYDLVGVMSVDYYGDAQTPVEMEKALNDLYSMYRQPVFLSEWSIPLTSLATEDINNKAQEFFESFARLRDKGILAGINYFDGLDYIEGVFTNNDLNDQGHLLGAFYAQGGKNEPNPALKEPIAKATSIRVEKKPDTTLMSQTVPPVASVSNPVLPTPPATGKTHVWKTRKTKKEPIKEQTVTVEKKGNDFQIVSAKLKVNYQYVIDTGIYMLIGASLTVATSAVTHIDFGNLLPYVMMVYTLVAIIVHALVISKL